MVRIYLIKELAGKELVAESGWSITKTGRKGMPKKMNHKYESAVSAVGRLENLKGPKSHSNCFTNEPGTNRAQFHLFRR